MPPNIPAEIADPIKNAVYLAADQVRYLHLSKPQAGSFIDQLVNREDIGGVLRTFVNRASVRTYIKDGILNRYSKDKKKEAEPSDQPLLVKQIFGLDVEESGREGKVVLYSTSLSGPDRQVEWTMEETKSEFSRLKKISKGVSPLVLSENERTVGGKYDFWADQTGKLYHYPKNYVNMIKSDRPFLYYRGERRATGKTRQTPDYFGIGTIGRVWEDPKTSDKPKARRKWFCSIENYHAFEAPVAFKVMGKPFEPIKNQAGWRNSVREIPWDKFEQILSLSEIKGGLRPPKSSDGEIKSKSPHEEREFVVVSDGTYLKWETALRKALMFIAKSPFGESGAQVHILLLLYARDQVIPQSDEQHLVKTLELVSANMRIYGRG